MRLIDDTSHSAEGSTYMSDGESPSSKPGGHPSHNSFHSVIELQMLFTNMHINNRRCLPSKAGKPSSTAKHGLCFE